MSKPSDLAAYLFEGQPRYVGLPADLLAWMVSSARFTALVDTYRDKIRKKARVTRDAESLLDLRAELEVAFRLLDDRRLLVAYEPYASAKRRGPDFAVTYRANLVFNVEVARIRQEKGGEERLFHILMDKLAQMQPGMPNLLAVNAPAKLVSAVDLARLMQEIKARAERKDAAFYDASRYASPAAFYKDFLHLSGILLWASAPAGPGPVVWQNRQSRPWLEEKVLRMVAACLGFNPVSGPGEKIA